MKLAVFAMVLILPAVVSAESGTQHISNCEGSLIQGGDAACGLLGTSYSTYDPKDCTVVCKDGQRPKLPKGVCLNGKVTCTSDVEQELEDWNLQNQEDYIGAH
uniref:Putative ixodes 10 kDa peptide protein n=1 Tax=Ixodes ricinus TaxID=34613 RepID=A0A0K8REQ4_IXORI